MGKRKSTIFLAAAKMIDRWEEDRSCVAVFAAATGVFGIDAYAHHNGGDCPAVKFYTEHVTGGTYTSGLFEHGERYGNGPDMDNDSQEAQDVRVLALLFAREIALDAEREERGWHVYPVPPDTEGRFVEDMDVIGRVLGSLCYQYEKGDDGTFYIARVSD